MLLYGFHMYTDVRMYHRELKVIGAVKSRQRSMCKGKPLLGKTGGCVTQVGRMRERRQEVEKGDKLNVYGDGGQGWRTSNSTSKHEQSCREGDE